MSGKNTVALVVGAIILFIVMIIFHNQKIQQNLKLQNLKLQNPKPQNLIP